MVWFSSFFCWIKDDAFVINFKILRDYYEGGRDWEKHAKIYSSFVPSVLLVAILNNRSTSLVELLIQKGNSNYNNKRNCINLLSLGAKVNVSLPEDVPMEMVYL